MKQTPEPRCTCGTSANCIIHGHMDLPDNVARGARRTLNLDCPACLATFSFGGDRCIKHERP
jgi:hypothetical protein